MALNDSTPNYIQPCLKERNSSIESVWLSPSDFGECYHQPSNTDLYPCLNPVYNGKALNLNPELVHATLSGISIKHYYGKCFLEPEEEEEEEEFYIEPTELYGSELFYYEGPTPSISTPQKTSIKGLEESTTDDSFEYREDSIEDEFLKPLCMQFKINFRNSFWNVHRPELCKLTWPQKYVSAATVTEHLHEHLIFHGPLCEDYHEEQDRINLLNKELDEYGRLKIILSPRELPPDEKFINFKMDEKEFVKALTENPRCRGMKTTARKPTFDPKDRFLQLSDDEEVEGKDIRRLKEEFCLTIGKHIRKQPIRIPEYCPEEGYVVPEMPCAAEGEASASWHFDWQLYGTEQSYEQCADDVTSNEDFDIEPMSLVDPCPPLRMDDFCRSIGKADFSDLRCNPDDF